MPSSLRPTVSQIKLLELHTLSSWISQKSINTLEQMKRYAFDVAIMSAFGVDKEEPTEIEAIKRFYQRLEKGYNSMPLDLPGTLFHKSIKGRRELNEEFRRVIEKRRNNGSEGGLLGVLLGAKDQKLNDLSDSQITDNIIGIIFAATDTTASLLT